MNRALLDQLYPPGSVLRNTGVVIYDTPDRRQPYAHQMTVGYVRELASSLAFHADYVRIMNRDMFLSRNLLPQVRADTTRTGAITRVDAYGLFGEDAVNYKQQVWAFENTGESNYDALNLQLERRYANRWSGRVSYSLSKSRGTATDQADRNTDQFLTDLRLDKRDGPTLVDRRHILSVASRVEVPKTFGMTLAATVRYMSGSPYTIYNSNVDVDQNGQLDDPVPAGSYSGIGEGDHVLKDVEYAGRAQRRLRPRLLPARPAGRMAEADPGAHDRGVRRHLQPDQPDQLRQPHGGGLRPADAGHLPGPDQPARRQRLPALGAVRPAVRVLSAEPAGPEIDTLRGARPATAGHRGLRATGACRRPTSRSADMSG